MDYEQLKSEVQQIAQIAASVPEPFQQRCFEVLLSALLESRKPPRDTRREEKPKEEEADTREEGSTTALPLNAQTRAWMKRTTVSEDQLASVLFVEDGEVHFVKEPTPASNADGQVEWSLLLALRNALLNGAFSVDAESVRSIVQDKGHYDRGNFASIFKRNASLYRSPPLPQGEAQSLSNEGQQKLGELVKRLAASS